jgi:hypothetical protein
MTLKVALFVEGSLGEKDRSGRPWLDILWRDKLAAALGLKPFARVVPFHKGQLTVLDKKEGFRRSPAMNVGLDELIRVELARDSFDAGIIAFDLLPPWDAKAKICRWEETLRFYRAMKNSTRLPEDFRTRAGERLAELEARARPSDRFAPPRLDRGSLLAVCMDPEFEALFEDEIAVRRVLGVGRKLPKGWPPTWGEGGVALKTLLSRAINAARSLDPAPKVLRQMRGDFVDRPHEWAAYFAGSGEARMLETISRHPTSQRLRELHGA